MKRFLVHLLYFSLFKSIYLYITYKLSFLKKVPFWINGQKIYLRPRHTDYAILNQIFVDKQYLPNHSLSNVKVILDAGANIGLSALYFHQRFPDARIICLEPEEQNF